MPEPCAERLCDRIAVMHQGTIVALDRPGTLLARSYEERQRKPDDLEAQEGQRAIAVHALEHLGTSDTGIAMLRHLLREQIVAASVIKNATVVTESGNIIQDPRKVPEQLQIRRGAIYAGDKTVAASEVITPSRAKLRSPSSWKAHPPHRRIPE